MTEAYVVDKNLGQPLLVEEGDLPQHNADGEPVVELTDEQKYLFDVRGWLLMPGVLTDDEIEAMREYALRVQKDSESLPEHERSFVAGPLEKLTDHPVVVGFLNEFLAFPGLSSSECYGFRMEGSGLRNPAATPERQGAFNPHNGSGFFRFAVDSHHYQSIPGKSFSGLTRVVWELAPVKMGQGRHPPGHGQPQGRLPRARRHPGSALGGVGDLRVPGRVGPVLHRGPGPQHLAVDQYRQRAGGHLQPLQQRRLALELVVAAGRAGGADAPHAPDPLPRDLVRRQPARLPLRGAEPAGPAGGLMYIQDQVSIDQLDDGHLGFFRAIGVDSIHLDLRGGAPAPRPAGRHRIGQHLAGSGHQGRQGPAPTRWPRRGRRSRPTA